MTDIDDNRESPSARAVVARFLARYLSDQEEGRVQPLAAYLQLFPGHDAALAAEFLRQRRDDRVLGCGDGVTPGARARANPVGTRVGPYRILRELGRGGQAIVYQAEDVRLRRTVALKILIGHGPASAEILERFRREAEAASKIDHPGICAVYDTGVEDDMAWIAMRYVEGATLARAIRMARERFDPREPVSIVRLREDTQSERDAGGEASTPPSTSQPGTAAEDVLRVVHIVEQAARALHAAHEAGVIHRDIKPGNIMVTPAGEPVILDFGLARELERDQPSLTRTGDLFGTPHYMSPEQIGAHRIRLDRRTDIWSLGVVLYECLTLERPFEATTREALYQAILAKDAPDPRKFNSAIPKNLRVVLDMALEKDRDRRYQTALDLAEDLQRVRGFQSVYARRAGWLLRLRRWCRWHPGRATACGGLLLILLAAALLLARRPRGEPGDPSRPWVTRDLALVKEMEARTGTLWTGYPGNLTEVEQWLRDARELLARHPLHARALEDTAARGIPTPGEKRHFDALAELVPSLREFSSSASIELVRQRLDLARRVVGSVDAFAERWDRAITAVAYSQKYRGLKLERENSLVPIGPDPESQLHEFAHLASGEIPERDPRTGRFVITEKSGPVLVLVPEGTFMMGAQKDNPEGPNYDPDAQPDESPVHEVRISAFYVSKFPVTANQLQRCGGKPHTLAPTNVAILNRTESEDICHRYGFSLPTEAQWEYAARAGSPAPA